jgi:hypothetical protein
MGSLITGVALVDDGERPSAFVIVEEREPVGHVGGAVTYKVMHVEHLPAGTPYPNIVRRVVDARVDVQRRRVVTQPGNIYVNAPAVGPEIIDVFRAQDLDATYVDIDGGDGGDSEDSENDGNRGAGPERAQGAAETHMDALVDHFQVLLHAGRIDLSPRDGGDGGNVLADELAAVEVVVTGAGGRTYRHTGAVLIALWLAVQNAPATPVARWRA